MGFLWPNMLWLLLVVPALVAAYVFIQRRRQKYALRYASLSLVREAVGRGPGFRRHVPPALFMLGIAVLGAAIARPVATVMLPSQQATVILAIDVSGSMRAEDMEPNRLEAAKEAARAFVENQPHAVRIGVVSFSDNAAIVQAPTKDRGAVLAAISRLAPQRGTAIGRGVLASLDAIFETPTQPADSRSQQGLALRQPTPTPTPVDPGSFNPAVVVLLSDGQSNVGPRPLDVISQAADRGVRVYTVGVGKAEGAILRFEGRSVRVLLDEETLRRMAQATLAQYFRADNQADLQHIYENLSTRLVFQPEKTELTAAFTACAAALLLAAGALSMLWFNRLP